MDNVCLISEDPDPIHDGLKRNINVQNFPKLFSYQCYESPGHDKNVDHLAQCRGLNEHPL